MCDESNFRGGIGATSSSLRKQQYRMLHDAELSDVYLRGSDSLGGDDIAASKVILAHRSPFFRRMFYGSFRESTASVVPLGFPTAVLKLVVEFCYTASIQSSLVSTNEEDNSETAQHDCACVCGGGRNESNEEHRNRRSQPVRIDSSDSDSGSSYSSQSRRQNRRIFGDSDDDDDDDDNDDDHESHGSGDTDTLLEQASSRRENNGENDALNRGQDGSEKHAESTRGRITLVSVKDIRSKYQHQLQCESAVSEVPLTSPEERAETIRTWILALEAALYFQIHGMVATLKPLLVGAMRSYPSLSCVVLEEGRRRGLYEPIVDCCGRTSHIPTDIGSNASNRLVGVFQVAWSLLRLRPRDVLLPNEPWKCKQIGTEFVVASKNEESVAQVVGEAVAETPHEESQLSDEDEEDQADGGGGDVTWLSAELMREVVCDSSTTADEALLFLAICRWVEFGSTTRLVTVENAINKEATAACGSTVEIDEEMVHDQATPKMVACVASEGTSRRAKRNRRKRLNRKRKKRQQQCQEKEELETTRKRPKTARTLTERQWRHGKASEMVREFIDLARIPPTQLNGLVATSGLVAPWALSMAYQQQAIVAERSSGTLKIGDPRLPFCGGAKVVVSRCCCKGVNGTYHVESFQDGVPRYVKSGNQGGFWIDVKAPVKKGKDEESDIDSDEDEESKRTRKVSRFVPATMYLEQQTLNYHQGNLAGIPCTWRWRIRAEIASENEEEEDDGVDNRDESQSVVMYTTNRCRESSPLPKTWTSMDCNCENLSVPVVKWSKGSVMTDKHQEE